MEWLFLFLTAGVSAISSITEEEFKAQLEDATLNTYRQHMEEMATIPRPPKFTDHDNFMRSYIPLTGVANREEIVIKNIQEVSSFPEDHFAKWRYTRFNNTDYMLSIGEHQVVMSKFESAELNFSFHNSESEVFNFILDSQSVVLDVTIFTRVVKRGPFLYVAILTQSSKASLVHIYEVVGSRGAPVALIELGINPSESIASAKKISYVQSQFGESLVVLINSPHEKMVYRQAGSNELNHYIGVHFPEAVDLVTFTVHGHGYIAVASSTAGKVFKLDEFARSDLEFDKLSSDGELVDLEYFRLGFHHFLVTVETNIQRVYQWSKGGLTEHDTFENMGVSQVYAAVLPTCRDDVLLFWISDQAVKLYIHNGVWEQFEENDKPVPENFVVHPGSITSFTHQTWVTLVFRDSTQHLMTFKIETGLRETTNPILEAKKDVSDFMDKIQEELNKQSEQIRHINDVLGKAVRTKGDQHITAHQKFENLTTDQSVVVHDLETIFLKWDGSNLTLEQYRTGIDDLTRDVEELERVAQEIEQILPDIVQLDEDAVITGTKTFIGEVTAPSILAYAVKLQKAAGIDLKKLQSEVYRLDKPEQIEGTLIFPNLTVTGDLICEGTINDIDFSNDVMTTNTKQTSTAMMNFKNKLMVQGDLSLSGKLNGIDISEEVVTLGGSHNITGAKIFRNGIIAGEVQTQFLDGVDVDDMYNRAFTKSGNQEVPGTVTFNGGLVTNDIILHGFLNGHNITELAENIVRRDQPAYITGHKTFLDDVTMESDLTVEGTVNGLRIPEDLFLTDVPQNVTGQKEFLGTVTAHNVLVEGTVDGLRIPEDIVTLSTDQEVSSTLYFGEGIHVENDITVHGLVDGIDIAEVVKQALKMNESHTVENAVFYGPVTVTGDMQVNGMINGMDLNRLVEDIVFKGEKTVIESKKHFNKVVADTVYLERMINGFNISVDFMKVHGDQEITGTKTFEDVVTFNSIDIRDGMIGNFNITQLIENRVTLEIEEEIHGEVEFSDDVIIEGDLIVRGTINGLKIPDDVVLRNSTKPIANKIFKKVKVDNLVVQGDTYVSGFFGGVDLNKLYEKRITLDGDQEIEGDIWIGNSSVESIDVLGLVDGKNITEFARNVMSKTKDQVITGEKTFTGTVVVLGPIYTKEGVNGVNLADLNDRAFKLQGNNIVTAPFEFEDITVHNMDVKGFINGVDLNHLKEDSLKKKGEQIVKGVTTFENGFHVQGNIVADTINGLFIPRDVLLKSYPQNITGAFSIENLEVSGDILISGTVNDLDLSEVAKKISRTEHETVIESDVTFLEPIHVMEDVHVTGYVNGIDLKKVSENILLREGNQSIAGHKILRGNVTIHGDIDVQYLNGYNWKQFLDDVVRIDRDARIERPVTFTSDIDADDVYAKTAHVRLLNGRDLEEFLDDVVFIDQPAVITGKKTFKNEVEIKNDLTADFINGLDLKKDVITLTCGGESPQIITGEKTFGNLTVNGNMDITGTVNSFNLVELYKDTLMIEGDQTITGMKTLTRPTFKGHLFPETVNGIRLKEELVTLDRDQVIAGPLSFNDPVYINDNLNVAGLVDGINITELAERAVYLDKDETIVGKFQMDTVIVTGDVAVQGLVNNMDLPEFDRNVTDFWKNAEEEISTIQQRSQDSCELAKYMQDVLSRSYFVLDGFAVYQVLPHSASYIQVKPAGELTLVHYENSSAVSVPYKWKSNGSYSSTNILQTTGIGKTIVHQIGAIEISINIGLNEMYSFVNIEVPHNQSLPQGFKNGGLMVKNRNEIIIALYIQSRGICKFFKMTSVDLTNVNIEPYGDATVGKDVTSMALFRVENSEFMAISQLQKSPSQGSSCHIYIKEEDGWYAQQKIEIKASKHVIHFDQRNDHYLAFTNVVPMQESKRPMSIEIYRNTSLSDPKFSFFQTIYFNEPQGLETFRFGDLNELHLTVWNSTVIQVFRLEGESGFQESFTIKSECIKDVKALVTEEDMFLVVGRESSNKDKLVSTVIYKALIKGTKYIPHKFKYC